MARQMDNNITNRTNRQAQRIQLTSYAAKSLNKRLRKQYSSMQMAEQRMAGLIAKLEEIEERCF